MPDKKDRSGTALAEKVYAALAVLPLDEGEALVEQARRLVWVQHFRGGDFLAIAAGLKTPETAIQIALNVVNTAQGDLLAAEEIFLEIRLALYMGAFGPTDSAFGNLVKSHQEEAERYRQAMPSTARH